MVKLLAKSPAHGLLPVRRGTIELSDCAPDRITSIAPFKGQEAAVSKALKATIGIEFPAPNGSSVKGGLRLVWSGLGQAMLLGARIEITNAALTDQSDAWTCLALHGKGAADVLARLTPLDLRNSQFQINQTARSLLGHMNALFVRTDTDRFEILVFRSMAQTAVHDLTRAMESITAQNH